MSQKIFAFVLMAIFIFAVDSTFAQKRKPANSAVRIITVVTEPKSKVWIDGVFRGETDDEGKLIIKPVMNGTRKIRVRADGFREVNKNLLARRRGNLPIKLVKTNDKAELAFQEAETLVSKNKSQAVELYRKAISLRPKYANAQLGLARVLSGMGDYEGALKAVADARKIRPVFPEASAIEGRVYKEMTEYDKAIDSFDRAIKEGKGFQPEAHTGLALLFKEEAESAKADNDDEDEKYYYGEAAKSFEKAIDQLSATESVVYLFLGKIYEDMGNKKKAIAVYERFLRDMPDHSEATAVESFIDQLKKPVVVQ